MKGLILSPLLLASVAAYNVISSMLSSLPITVPASFDCRITSLWTPERHPRDYSSEAMFEVPIVVSHGTAYAMFVLNESASTGLQKYAETGVTQDLEMDIIAVYDKTNAIKDVKKGVDMPIKQLITFRLNGLKVDKSRHFVTAVTRLSPSPDWFTGFNAFSTKENGFWYSDFVIETWALDTGTSTGFTYTDKPIPETPVPRSIQMILNGVFNSLPVARWRCELMTRLPVPQEVVSSAPEQTPVTQVPMIEETAVPSLAPTLSTGPTAETMITIPSAAPITEAPSTTISIPSVTPTMEFTSAAISSVPSIVPTMDTEVMSNAPTRAPFLAPASIVDLITGTPTAKPAEMPSKVPAESIDLNSPTDFPSNDFSDASSTPVTEESGDTSGTHDNLSSLAFASLALLLLV